MFSMKGLKTRFSKETDLTIPLPEHPNPYFEREDWVSLNGKWGFKLNKSTSLVDEYERTIIIPFSPETELSGIHHSVKPDNVMHYFREFVPDGDHVGRKALLHFLAVDQVADVYWNGQFLGTHEGGYLPFEFEVRVLESNTLELVVVDDTDSDVYPKGKQTLKPGGIFYNPTSGIWQSVYLEYIPEEGRFESFSYECDFDNKKIRIFAKQTSNLGKFFVNISFKDSFSKSFESNSDGKAEIDLSDCWNPWTPENPNLYDLELYNLKETIHSVIGLRKWSLIDIKGKRVPALNNKPILLSGVLDQGYYPESGLTAPSEEALLFDIRHLKKCGFNAVRKHIKIDRPRFYFNCDKEGLIVIQDFVSSGSKPSLWRMAIAPILNLKIDDTKHAERLARPTYASKDYFEEEMPKVIEHLRNYTCIGMWTLFNEGWGQFDSSRLTSLLRKLDPTRLIDSNSGWYDQKCGDYLSNHIYFWGLKRWSKDNNRALGLSEFGGLSLKIEDHVWSDKIFGYKTYKTKAALNKAVKKVYLTKVIPAIKKDLLSYLVWTQLSDVEEEINGLLTYDREIEKVDSSLLFDLNDQCQKAFQQSALNEFAERKPEIKIAFFDLDWTLYDHRNHRWNEKCVDAVKAMKEKGIKCIICTARPYHSFKELGTLDLGIEWDGYISSSGACAFADGKFLKKDLMAKEDVEKAIEFLKSHGETGEIVEPLTRKLVGPHTESSESYYSAYRESRVEIEPYEGEEVVCMNLFISDKYDAELPKIFSNLQIFRYFKDAVDLTPVPHIKGEGIKCVLDHFGLSKDDAISFGDDIQDLSMAEQTSVFVAMGNARKEVRDQATFICDDVWGEGIVPAVKKFCL